MLKRRLVSQNDGAEIRHERTGLVFRPGLEGVPATQSSICDIDGHAGCLSYRGYPCLLYTSPSPRDSV